MRYAERLRILLAGVTLTPNDLLLLEPFQVKYLPDRVPQKEFSVLLKTYPYIQELLVLKAPSIKEFINTILHENETPDHEDTIETSCDEAVWEIADLIVYNKHPELYNEKIQFSWKIQGIVSREFLKGKIVADIGAGSGVLSFLLARWAHMVFAVEPVSSFRSYMREKAKKEKQHNIHVVDGYLESIPFPENFFDVLMTSNAIGWNLEKELPEIERVVKPGGHIIHLLRSVEKADDNPFHEILISPDWKYECIKIEEKTGLKIKYLKTLQD